MQEILNFLQAIGPTAAIAAIAFWFFDKKDQRADASNTRTETVITAIVNRHESERKEWYVGRDRQEEKVTKAINGLADAIRAKDTDKTGKTYFQGGL